MSSAGELPAYAPVSVPIFDRARMLDEFRSVAHLAEARHTRFAGGRSVWDRAGVFRHEPDRDLADTDHLSDGELVAGRFSSFRVMGCTRLASEPATWTTENSLVVGGERVTFWHHFREPWEWRPEMSGSYLREYVESLPFEYVQGVKYIHMSPPAIGQAHIDSARAANRAYLADGFGSITLDVCGGGGHLVAVVGGSMRRLGGDAFHFDDSYLHGVTRIDGPRLQVRVWGHLGRGKYLGMMDLDRAIWDEQ